MQLPSNFRDRESQISGRAPTVAQWIQILLRWAAPALLIANLGCDQSRLRSDSSLSSDAARVDTARTAPVDDPFDVSASSENLEAFGIPTPAEVERADSAAWALFDAGRCEEAIPALEAYAKQANWLANLIAAGLEPFYDASYDDRRAIRRSEINRLAAYENRSNTFKRRRNEARVLQGECLLRLDRREEGLAVLLNALSLIEVDDTDTWARAQFQVYELIELEGAAGNAK